MRHTENHFHRREEADPCKARWESRGRRDPHTHPGHFHRTVPSALADMRRTGEETWTQSPVVRRPLGPRCISRRFCRRRNARLVAVPMCFLIRRSRRRLVQTGQDEWNGITGHVTWCSFQSSLATNLPVDVQCRYPPTPPLEVSLTPTILDKSVGTPALIESAG